MKVVLLSGWSQSGKDTVGTRLMLEHGFHRFAFADPVKDVAAQQYGFDRTLADSQEGKASVVAPRNFFMPAGRTVREWVIHVGEERKRVHGGGCWAREIAGRLKATASFDKRFVLTDWRFPEELVALQQALPATTEFYPVRLVRPGQRVSPVGSMTEYALSGFPMPSYDSMNDDDMASLLRYCGVTGSSV